MTQRYAVYFAPSADSELGQFGQTVLCRSAKSERKSDAGSSFTNPTRWLELTDKPAHYGFHATLKAPFELKSGHTIDTLVSSVAKFTHSKKPIELSSLFPRNLGGFLALTLESEIDELSRFALSCVEAFEPYREALSEADIKRRQLQALSGRQGALLLEYGYPFVADEFRFHLTLSGKLSESDQYYENWIIGEYNRLITKTPVLDRLAIFTQADRQSPFVEIAEFSLAR